MPCYSYTDPNAGNVVRTKQGTSYTIVNYGICNTGKAIRIYDGATEVLFSCYNPGSLTITPVCPAPSVPCDCLNGACIPKTTYNTPGKYPSLAACEAGCAKDSSCSGECVSAAELSALQEAAAKVRGKLCNGFI